MRKILKLSLALIAGAVLCVGLGSWWLGGRLAAPVSGPVARPAELAVQEVVVPGSPELAGWWVEADKEVAAVLLLHPIRANRASMVTRAELLLKEGFSVLLVDLQAHGETPGEVITLGARESANARAALRWLRSRRPGGRVGVIGASLGGAAVLLGSQPAGFDAVVLEAVYPEVARAVENRIRMRLGPLAPVLTPLLLVQLRPRLGFGPESLRPIAGVSQLGAPVLVAAGEFDQHTTLEESEELFAAAAEPKELWVVRGAKHQDFLAFDPMGYREHVVGFLRKYLASRG